MNRSTISHHRTSLGNEHLDIFFENEDYLETYEAPYEKFNELIREKKILCSKKKPHRKVYLDYEGEISDQRGSILILWTGFYLNENSFFPD